MKSRLVCLVLLAMASVGTGTPVFAQFGGIVKKERTVKIFTLVHVSADDARKVVSDLFPPQGDDGNASDSGIALRFATDKSTNSLIAAGDAESLGIVEAILLKLDAKPQSGSGTAQPKKSIVIKLNHTNPTFVQVAMKELQVKGLSSLPDGRTNSLLLTGPEEAIVSARNLIEQLDRPTQGTPPRTTDVSIRIVWLIEKSLAPETAPAVPPDLVSTIDALRKKVGIGELKAAAQSIIQVSSTEPNAPETFSSSGTAELEHPELQPLFQYSFTGTVAPVGPDQYSLQIELSVKEKNTNSSVCQLSTHCAKAFLGKPIILGANSINSKSSLFVIQILDIGAEPQP